MKHRLPKSEAVLWAAGLILVLLAWLAPPLAQAPHYHDFADQRSWLGLPCALDVLSNLPFALFGLAGWLRLRPLPPSALPPGQYPLAVLFFGGLILTALCSSVYHWRPDDAGLALDRAGMTVAFAGLLGLAVADRIGARAGTRLAVAVLLLGPLSIWIWHASGNLLPWALLQGGGVVLLLALAVLRPLPGALAVRWGAVVLIYAVAKGLELADREVFALSGELVSGHSLKHLVAALAAWPVIGALPRLRQNQPEPADFAETRMEL
ncbi:MAG: hypothetical protein OEY75_03250 [Hylemonella sp.]|nr:hypothetical protein [Hylemonella sp.]